MTEVKYGPNGEHTDEVNGEDLQAAGDLFDRTVLEGLKERGGAYIKEYNEGIPDECIIVMEPWLISYVVEKTFITEQKTLAISLLNRGEFDEESIPSVVKEVFSELFPPRIKSISYFPKRGFTLLFGKPVT